jgi:GWxTD domain-containing protein
MIERKAILSLLLTVSAVSVAQASGLSKRYKNWDRSPEAYFLTNSEKTQWRQVKTDAEAQSFILDYKARRGPDFDKMLNEREAIADKYFSSGETKGSETLRGKVVIIFGPPSSIQRIKGNTGERPDVTRIDNFSSGGPAMSSSGTAGPMSPHANAPQLPIFSFLYDKDAAPKAIGKPFQVELKMYSNAEQEPEDVRDMDAKVEAMAEASVMPSEPAKETKQP